MNRFRGKSTYNHCSTAVYFGRLMKRPCVVSSTCTEYYRSDKCVPDGLRVPWENYSTGAWYDPHALYSTTTTAAAATATSTLLTSNPALHVVRCPTPTLLLRLPKP